MKYFLSILVAGCVGTLCRYGITRLPMEGKFPYSTFAVNLFGSFLAGFCYIFLKTRYQEYAHYFPALFIGFFGAFTTFSTFMLDTAKYLESGHCGMAFLNIVLQNALGLLCVWCGMLVGKQME